MLKRIPAETRKKLAGKGYFPQDGYILQYLPVPPNCLSVPEISDGVSVMSSDPSISMLKKVLRQVEGIKNSRSGEPNFQSHEVEANELQIAVNQYLQVRGTAKASRDIDTRFGVSRESNDSSTKAWLEKIRTLFIRKGSGFSSRSVITGDAYKRVNEIGIPFEIAQRITFEERVNVHNMKYLQELVDNKLCLTFRDGSSTYSLREGSKGHTFLRPGQVVHRRIMDGDFVFINRPPTTHKHSLQALAVYVHDDHTVKINPLICGPLSADFDGDCVHLFYPQSLPAKAEVLELFSVDKQLLSSHSGNLNLQLTSDSLLSLKTMFKTYFLHTAAAQQLAMFASSSLPHPALLKAHSGAPHWTALQMLQTALPAHFDSVGERFLISQSEMLKFDFNRDVISSLVNEIVTSIFSEKGPEEVLKFFNSLQPLLMENIFADGFSVGLEDFSLSREAIQNIQKNIQVISPLLYNLRSTYNGLVELQLENRIKDVKAPVTNFVLKSSALGDLIDSKNDSAINKVVQQIGFLGLQLSDKGKFYSKTLIEDVASLFESKYSSVRVDYPSAEYGLVQGCFFHGLDPYEEMVHSISTREVIVRSSRGLSEPGTLFKNLMAILRDVVICYDGTVRNVSSNSIIQFEYGVKAGTKPQNFFPAGEPVGVLAATAMSNPAYKAVLDSTPSSNSSWELMKEILLCKVNFKNEHIDRRVILYLNECGCGRKYCREKAAYLVKNQLKKVSLKDAAVEFLIEYKRQRTVSEGFEIDAGLVGHVHLNETMLKEMNTSMHEVLQKCQETINSYRKKKKKATPVFKRTVLSVRLVQFDL
uniref:DNA-directed RNA polymerase n=1 Tax=Fagus sylvatica TaxID=28930 RepID=A0A2N9I789_FAGSY